jgi:hypothetical protein
MRDPDELGPALGRESLDSVLEEEANRYGFSSETRQAVSVRGMFCLEAPNRWSLQVATLRDSFRVHRILEIFMIGFLSALHEVAYSNLGPTFALYSQWPQ